MKREVHSLNHFDPQFKQKLNGDKATFEGVILQTAADPQVFTLS